ncbi:DNA-binding transcriptional LysR family regulator [Kribbella orskensis]|uniref:DNA-binding transcriptional LysR family regulator n=1 Tax=Kribbella orskensis TaxID=2512216 RepID=A0ABY2BA94_9ACTN|nr:MULTISPECIES: LysR family transcriptional regulator [Kribbella]TCN32850.1 DNA-binding transcriptional LysR family regulator [Kribbella sp. VKM Ac-2500]TCO13276.1 DNA-binding transcriptional LysR family regulator [Kribbella orskensis]
MLELRRLRLLNVLATEGTVTATAEAVHISGPAVSQQLAQLERETGVQLVERVGRRLRLTEAGLLLVAHTRIVLDQLAAAEADLVALGTEIAGTVRVAAFSSAMGTLVAETWQQLRAEHAPRIRLQLTTLEPEQGLDALMRGDADIVIAYSYELAPGPMPTSVERQALLADPVVLAVAAGDPLNAPRSRPLPVPLAELADRDWLVPDAMSACYRMVEHACRAAGFVPRTVAKCAEFSAMLALVAAGEAVALVPQLATLHRPENVALLPITPATARHIFTLTRPGGARHPAVRVVLEHLAEAAGAV